MIVSPHLYAAGASSIGIHGTAEIGKPRNPVDSWQKFRNKSVTARNTP